MSRAVVRPSDLTPEARKRYGVDAPKGGRKRPSKSRAGVGDGQPCAGSCGCGQRFVTFTAWERHARQSGHRKWQIEIEER